MRWLAGRRERSGLAEPMLPPKEWRPFSVESIEAVPRAAGVFRLFDHRREVLRIAGVADVRRGLLEALTDPASGAAVWFEVELDELFTQRESELLAQYVKSKGQMPPGNDLEDDLFGE